MPSSEAAPSASASSSRASSPAPSDTAAGKGGRRKSTRTKKEIKRLDPKGRKSTAASDSDEPSSASEPDDDFSASGGEDDEEFKAPKGKKKTPAKRGRPAAAGKGGAKKTRTPRARKAAAEDGADEDGEEGAKGKKASGKDFKIEDDIGLFNAVKSPNTALQQTAEDWIEQYQEDSGPAMAELVNFVLRCCGCNATVDEHQAEDENGIVENLKDIVDEFKQETDHAYPLVSKTKSYKKFRASLTQFLNKLLVLSADDGLLYSTSFFGHFTSWLFALSSSQIRALRHTATFVVLALLGALSELHVAVKKEHGQAVRAKEAEEKKGRKDKGRLRDMQRQVKEVHERLASVEELLKESYDSVFVNRYRDADAVIRAECISALGSWMKIDPDLWIDGDYLRYIGWVLSDESKDARRESVKALFSLYQKDTHIGKLHHFTDHFRQRLVDMAVAEHDMSVRIQAIHVCRQIDHHGLLDDKQRDEVATLVFEREKRVRTAAAEFWKGIVEEQVEERKEQVEAGSKTPRGRKKGARSAKDKEREREQEAMVAFKVLAELLVKYGRELDGPSELDGEDLLPADKEDDIDAPAPAGGLNEDDPAQSVPRGRVAFAVEALWDGIDPLRDWESLLAFLLRDHSAAHEGSPATPSKKGKGKKRAAAPLEDDGEDEDEEDEEDEEEVKEIPEELRLSEEEESLMLEVFVASANRVVQGVKGGGGTKKEREQDEEDLASLSRAVIDGLPKLFSKHQTYPGRMVDVLSIPRLVNLDLYLDMGQVTAYESLWDDIMKQFLKHTSSAVLDQAALTFVHFLSLTNLSATNSSKLSELEDQLVTSLRTLTSSAGEDVESATLGDDEVLALAACVARVEKLAKVRNISNALEDTDGGKETAAVDILDAIVNRGRLGYKDEAPMIEHALNVLGTHLIWQLQSLAVETRQAGSADVGALVVVQERRQALLERMEEFAVGNETNAAEGVKQVALAFLLNIYSISRQLTSSAIDPEGHLSDLKLTASDELQARCAGYVEAEIERYAEQLAEAAAEAAAKAAAEKAEEERENEQEESGSETETEETARSRQKKKGKGKGKKAAKGKGKEAPPKKPEKRKKKSAAQLRAENVKQQSALIAAQRFEQTLAPFVRAVHCGALDLRHAVVLLKHFGRLGAVFDEHAKLLMHDLRDEGNFGSLADLAASVIVEALQGACEIYLDAPESAASASEDHLVALGRNLVQVVVVRGAHLAIVSHIPTEDHLRIHLDALKFIVKKIAHFEETKRKDERNRAIVFFKALAHLLFGLDGRSALKVKTSLEALLDEHNVEVAETSKTWEPVRAYQRRLVTAMAKDPTIHKLALAEKEKEKEKKGKAKGKGKKSKGALSDDDELSDSNEAEESVPRGVLTPEPEATPARSRRRGAPPAVSQELGVPLAGDEQGTAEQQTPASGRSRGSKRAAANGADSDAEQSSPRKRQRRDAAATATEKGKERETSPSTTPEQEAAPDADETQQDNGDLGSTLSQSQSQSAALKKRRLDEDDDGPAADDSFGGTGDIAPTQTQSGGDSGKRGASPFNGSELEQDEEEERPHFEREASMESTMSLSDLKKKKKRARR
ncbi:hypothetical protein JCM10213_007796 [Rhodosporidiobolus nylandii]